tara:strand:+ start:127 stop:504 length:378 start_codon:yes stop_codon:yes gene_type:complete
MTITAHIPGSFSGSKEAKTQLKKKSMSLSIFVTVFGTFLLLLFIVGSQSFLVAAHYEVDQLQIQLKTEKSFSQELRREVAELKNPERIREVAEGRLGMLEPPSRIQIEPVQRIEPPIGNPFLWSQ